MATDTFIICFILIARLCLFEDRKYLFIFFGKESVANAYIQGQYCQQLCCDFYFLNKEHSINFVLNRIFCNNQIKEANILSFHVNK